MPRKPKGGPAPRLPQKRAQLLQAAKAGSTNRDAAAICGIAESTLYKWIAEHEDFGAEYETARAHARDRSVKLIADSDDWRAHAWLQERRDPANWGKAEIDTRTLEEKLIAYLQGHQDATNAVKKEDA